jgi:DNA-binding MarR family transcriptional regulator
MVELSEAAELEAVRALVRVARLLERSGGEVSLAHYRILAAVAGGDERASRMAARLALGKPAISAAVDALCRRGLLARHEVAGDQRATALSLTAEGAAELEALDTAMLGALRSVLDRTERPAELVTSLGRMGSALDVLGDERQLARRGR